MARIVICRGPSGWPAPRSKAPGRLVRPAVPAYALFALADVRWEPGTAAERLSIAGELAVAAAAAGETELVLEAYLCRLVALLELGDPSFTVQLGSFTRLAERAAIPRYLYLARSRQATAASLTGPLEKADELIAAAAAYGERIGEPDVWAVESSQLIGLAFIRHDWIRLNALAAARGQVLTPPEFAWHERAWLLIEAGERDAAAALVASVPISPAAYRWRHTAMLTSDAELAGAVADRRRCTALYEQLLPMADEFAVVGAAVFTTGPVALQLGLLAAALGRWDDAARHLGHAVTRCDRLGARLHGDRARAELERLPTARARAGGLAGPGPSRARSAAMVKSGPSSSPAGPRSCGTPRACETWLSCSPHPARRWPRRIWSPQWRSRSRPSAPTWSSMTGPGPNTGPSWPTSTTSWRRPTRTTTSSDRPGWRPNAMRSSTNSPAPPASAACAAGWGTPPSGRVRRSRPGSVTPSAGSSGPTRSSAWHLRASIVTGTRCAYRPAETVRWSVSQS